MGSNLFGLCTWPVSKRCKVLYHTDTGALVGVSVTMEGFALPMLAILHGFGTL